MVTDDERREVVRRLRESVPEGGVFPTGDTSWSRLYRTLFGRYMPIQRAAITYGQVVERLADLIEPPARSSKAIRTEASRLDWNDLAPKADIQALWDLADQVDAACALIDRDALLELADEMENDTWYESSFDHRTATSFAYRIRKLLKGE